MNILIHPTYFPTIAHFIAIAKADIVTFETADNFQKQSYRNRMNIYGANGKLLLNVPVKHNKEGLKTAYKEVEIENVELWQNQHWRSIVSAYKSSPFFEYYEDELQPFFTNPQSSLFTLNENIFKALCDCIELDIKIETTTVYNKEYTSESSITDLRYLARAKKPFIVNNSAYIQVFGDKHGYLPNLSILDLLFNEGPNTLNYLEQETPFWI
ncbi:WbqC family protein [Pseudofulvibacter geojedonensis]|uniref:WbqC family protein n=1 Tax=Pseudofulvibacter geojedonensis TaxID=1123758 RepID=A0ABW3I2E9_9FLAO